jgi:hypothetical protein
MMERTQRRGLEDLVVTSFMATTDVASVDRGPSVQNEPTWSNSANTQPHRSSVRYEKPCYDAGRRRLSEGCEP